MELGFSGKGHDARYDGNIHPTLPELVHVVVKNIIVIKHLGR